MSSEIIDSREVRMGEQTSEKDDKGMNSSNRKEEEIGWVHAIHFEANFGSKVNERRSYETQSKFFVYTNNVKVNIEDDMARIGPDLGSTNSGAKCLLRKHDQVTPDTIAQSGDTVIGQIRKAVFTPIGTTSVEWRRRGVNSRVLWWPWRMPRT
jgi:hypothetical protein